MAGAQMREVIGETGPAVDLRQHLGDAHPRQHVAEPVGQFQRSVGDRRLEACDVELAVLDFDTVEIAAFGARGDESEPLMQAGRARGDIRIGIDFFPELRGCNFRGRRRKQIILEGSVSTAALDPDSAALQPVAQCCEDGGLVKPAIRRTACKNQLSPLRGQKGRWRTLWQGPGSVAVQLLQDIHGGQHRIVRRVRPKTEGIEKAGAESAKNAIAFGGRDEDFLVRDSGDRLDDRHGVIETFHVDLLLDDGETILARRLGLFESGDRAAEQDQGLRHIAFRGLETALAAMLRLGEQRAHVPLEHGKRRIGESGFQVNQLSDEQRRAT